MGVQTEKLKSNSKQTPKPKKKLEKLRP